MPHDTTATATGRLQGHTLQHAAGLATITLLLQPATGGPVLALRSYSSTQRHQANADALALDLLHGTTLQTNGANAAQLGDGRRVLLGCTGWRVLPAGAACDGADGPCTATAATATAPQGAAA